MRAPARKPPATLTGPPDGTTLEDVIGALQSEWGVPQRPQEFRITLKLPDERDLRNGKAAVEEVLEDPTEKATQGGNGARPRREKAPAAPRIGGPTGETAEGGAGAKTGATKKRSRRRRRRRKSGG